MNEPCQILLVSDGKGIVILFKDGKPCSSVFDCRDRIDPHLELWLEKNLVCKPEEEKLPF